MENFKLDAMHKLREIADEQNFLILEDRLVFRNLIHWVNIFIHFWAKNLYNHFLIDYLRPVNLPILAILFINNT